MSQVWIEHEKARAPLTPETAWPEMPVQAGSLQV